jgi:CRP-like cAMP-binding protein
VRLWLFGVLIVGRLFDGRQVVMQRLSISQDVQQNRLLASLPTEAYRQLHPHLVPLELTYRLTLYEANQPIPFLYFVNTGVASLINSMKNGQAAEVGTIGNEGVVGMPVVFGDATSLTSVYIQVPGSGLKIKSSAFREIMRENEPLRTSMFHYAHAFFNQVAQNAACNLFHPIEQRCCRWLLTTRDRMQSDCFPLTQEFLAMMLGVQRTGVTHAAANLQRAGLIEYTRGNVKILDRVSLEQHSCECYGVTKRDFDRLLGIFESVSKTSRQLPRIAVAGTSLKSN